MSTDPSDEAPVSLLEQHYWMLHQVSHAEQPHNLSCAMQLHGIDAERLQLALAAVLRAQPTLLRIFEASGNKPLVQRTCDDAGVIQFEDLSHLTPAAQLTRFADTVSARFRLDRQPALRVQLYKTAPRHLTLLLVSHRCLADQTTLAQIALQAQRHYTADSTQLSSPSPNPELPTDEPSLREAIESIVAPDGFLDLGISKARPGIQSYAGAICERPLPRTMATAVHSFATEQQVSVSDLLLTAYFAVLSRYGATSQLTVGEILSGRTRANSASQWGCYENVVPLSQDFSAELTFAEALGQVVQARNFARSQQCLAWPDVLRELNPTRNTSYHPVFQTAFEARSLPSLDFGSESKCQRLATHNAGSAFDLTLQWLEQPDAKLPAAPVQGQLRLEYSKALFDAASIRHLLDHLLVLLQAGCEQPDSLLNTLPLLTGNERERQLVQWNKTSVELSERQGLHALFEAQAQRTPERIAVQFEDVCLTYSQLDAQSNQLAHFLRNAGVGPDVLVGVCLERSEWMLISLLGILKAGGGYVPMDPEYPTDRIAYMVEHSRAPWILTSKPLLEKLPPTDAQVLCIDRDLEQIQACPTGTLQFITQPEHLAYVIYTSGSTGKPKGVQVPQGAAHNFIASMATTPGMNSDDVLVAVTTLSFDIAVLELYLPIAVGARTVIASKSVAADGNALLKLMKSCNATLLQATPATWFLLLASGMKLPQLKALCGGEALPQDLAVRLLPRTSSLWNMYGPTETTVWSTCYQIENAEQPLLVGRPIDNTTVYVLDEHLQPIPVGLTGELHIGGLGVTRGYLHRDDLTNERFIADPFSEQPEARLYKTGDAALFLPDGNLRLLHRLDNQVKVRGFRIELGEIESVLVQHPGVQRNVVIVREDTPGDKRIVCYWVPEETTSPSAQALRSFAGESLPPYMIPQHFVALAHLPQTPNGKIDRKALPEVAIQSAQVSEYTISDDLILLPQDQWHSIPVYRPAPLPSVAQQPERGVWWFFLDDLEVGEKLAKRLEDKGHQVIRIRSTDAYQRVNATEYCLNPEQGSEPYERLVRALAADGYLPNHVVHSWLLTGAENFRPGSSLFYRHQEHGFQSLKGLHQALASCDPLGRVNYTVLTNGAQSVGGEPLRYPEKSTAVGACAALRGNSLGHSFRAIDLDLPAVPFARKISAKAWKSRARIDRAVRYLEDELLVTGNNETVAYRAGQRLTLNTKRLPAPLAGEAMVEANRGDARTGDKVCLITGGLSQAGLSLADALTAQGPVRLILIDSFPLPPEKDWQGQALLEPKGCISRLLALQTAGAQLFVDCADPADGEAMRRVSRLSRKHFGSIDYVVHLAGVAACTQGTTAETGEQLRFDALVHGSRVVAQTFGAQSNEPVQSIVYCTGLHALVANDSLLVTAAACSYVQAHVQQAWASGDRSCTLWGMFAWSTQANASLSFEKSNGFDFFETHLQHCSPDLSFIQRELAQILATPTRAVRWTSALSLAVQKQEVRRASLQTCSNTKLAPRDKIERTLVKFWQDVLGLSEIGVRDNFFEIGGHSLTAVRLFGEIQHEYQVEWPLAVLFEAPTIEACAARIRAALSGDESQREPDSKYVVEMHSGPGTTSLPPLFVVAGAFGNILNLRHLAQLLGHERAVYGVQARGLNGNDAPHETIENTAEDYLKEIQAIQADGPYVLAGFCSGGTIAYEMSRQLERAGQDVTHLLLLDATAPTWIESPLTRREKNQVHAERLRLDGFSYPKQWVKSRLRWEKQLLRQRIYGTVETQSPAVFRSQTIYDATMRAEAKYNPQKYDGKTILLRPRLDRRHVFGPDRAVNSARDFVRHDNGWTPHLPDLTIREIAADAGDHDGFVLEPAVRDLVRQIQAFLQE